MLSEIKKYIYSASSVNLSELEPNKTVLVIVDMINGFVNEGALASPRIKNIIPEVSELVSKCREKNIDIIAFADCHKENAIEFESFPVHCLENTSESEVINEIKDKILTVIPKNSTNGFHAPEFQKLLAHDLTRACLIRKLIVSNRLLLVLILFHWLLVYDILL